MIEKLEQQISSRSAEFRAQNREIKLADIQQAVPDNAALLEFAYYYPIDAKTNKYLSAHYAVYILQHNSEPLFADLGEAELIDRAIAAVRKVLPDSRTNIEKDVKPATRVLDEMVMRPVRKLIGDKRRLLIVPDGALNLVPFDALIDEQGRYLVENYEISYLTSGRDLLRLQNGIAGNQQTVIFANPDFGDKKSNGNQRDLGLTNSNSEQGAETFSGTIDFSKFYFSPLPGTAAEAEAIVKIVPNAKVYTKQLANKENLQSIDSPSILHIATHGFFIDESSIQAISGQTTTRLLLQDEVMGGRELSLGRSTISLINPLLRSGLSLAGANNKTENNNGIFTALEVVGLNLWGTRLVVLSACDTAVGEIKNGDGVYGLRRALVLAGSESQLMSLWPVSDVGTKELMTAYYQALNGKEGRSAALRSVRLSMLMQPKRAHPYYWASFIQSGEWANLQGKR